MAKGKAKNILSGMAVLSRGACHRLEAEDLITPCASSINRNCQTVSAMVTAALELQAQQKETKA